MKGQILEFPRENSEFGRNKHMIAWVFLYQKHHTIRFVNPEVGDHLPP